MSTEGFSVRCKSCPTLCAGSARTARSPSGGQRMLGTIAGPRQEQSACLCSLRRKRATC